MSLVSNGRRPGFAASLRMPFQHRLVRRLRPLLPGGPPGHPQEWADAIFHRRRSGSACSSVSARCSCALVGIEPGDSHVFDTSRRNADEVLLGIDQGHLSFRASVLLERRLESS